MKNSKRNVILAILFLIPFSFIWFLNRMSDGTITELTIESNEYSRIDKPFENVDVPVNVFTVYPDSDQVFTTWSGSKVHVPAHCFIDKKGEPIKDSVQIVFKEYHRSADIICSGIPMQNEGSDAIMETAGMFEISGTYNGSELEFQEGKEIEVDLVSFNEGNDFNFFELEKNSCQWKDLGTNIPVENMEKTVALKQLDQQISDELLPFKNKKSLKTNQYFDFQLDYSSYPELAPFKNVVWMISDAKHKMDDLFREEWDSIQLNQTRKGYYSLALYHSSEILQMTIMPVLEGDDYDLALQQFNQQTQGQRNEIIQKINEKRQRVESMANIRRLAKINKMGVFNFDIWKALEFDKCRSEILVDNQVVTDEEMKGTRFFVIDQEQKYVIYYNLKTIKDNFVYDPHKKSTVLAILKDGSIAFVDWTVLEEHSKSAKKSTITLDFQNSKQSINTTADVQQIIDNIFVG